MQQNITEIINLGEEALNLLQLKEKKSIIKNSLKSHQIDENFRAKMVDWMIEVISKFELSIKTFFLAVRIMDKFLEIVSRSFDNNDLLLLGVTCMYIASKFEDVETYNMQIFIRQIGHNKFTSDNLKNLEREILITLNFNIDMPLSVDFLTLICEAFRIPVIVKTAAENLLIFLQLYYDLQFSPSLETACSIAIAADSFNIKLNSKIYFLLYNEADFSIKIIYTQQLLISTSNHMKKYKNAFIYRRFEILPNHSGVYIINKEDEANDMQE